MTPQDPSSARHVVVIGAGLAGLAASYELVKTGCSVTLIEKEPEIGGLAVSTNIQGHSVEHFYHFICASDQEIIQLAGEMNLKDRLHWKHTRTAFYYHQKLYPFGTPFDLIRFRPIPWIERLRFGFHITTSRYRSCWKWLDHMPAKPWLIENIGEQAYNVIWDPLLKVKFGNYHDKISAAWVWHRIWRVAKSRKQLWDKEVFGYFEDGSATLANNMVEWLCQQPNFSLRLNTPIQAVQVIDNQVHGVVAGGQTIACSDVISTMPLPQLSQILPDLEHPYFQRLKQIDYIGVVCAVFQLKKSFSPYFWMNIHDPRISYNGIIELSNLNQGWQAENLHLLYIPFYLRTDEPRYHYSDEVLFREYIQSLKLINPAFDEDWITRKMIFRAPYAQAICTTNFADLRPEPATPVEGMYISDSTQFYPEDRTLSAAVRQGKLVAQAALRQHA